MNTPTHKDAFASAWDSYPYTERVSYLKQAGADAYWIPAAADARWYRLPAIVRERLKHILPTKIVELASADLKARELD